jgi:molybdopterin/thiamine biosynthesis adenylyltransferase
VDHSRHMNIFNVSDLPVTQIGAGGIGAATALALAKMGVPGITLYDNDVIDHVNLSTQLHKVSDVGMEKPSAVGKMVEEFSDEIVVSPHFERAGENTKFRTRVVISAVDSINARKDIWKAVVNSDRVEWYLDARMAAEQFQLHTVKLDDRDWYEALIDAEDESVVPELACTAKATIFTAFVAAGLIGKTIRQIVTDITPPRKLIYDIKGDDLMAI